MNATKMGERIKACRKGQKMTQTDLASRFGLRAGAVSKWENGRVTNLKHDIIIELSKIFGVAPTWLMGITDVKESPAWLYDPYGQIKDSMDEIAHNYESPESIPGDVMEILKQLNEVCFDLLLNQSFLKKARGDRFLKGPLKDDADSGKSNSP